MTHPKMPPLRHFSVRRQRGFSLLELTISLLVIGLLLGAVAIGSNLQRAAVNQRLSTDFVQGWQLAYEAYINGVGHPPGDNPTDPSGRVNANANANANANELCGNDLINAFLAAGIRLPEGRKEGAPDRYAYFDSNGNPQEVQVCFKNVDWAEPGATVSTYVSRKRNVMLLKNVTYALAATLDQQIDSRSDARFGRLRDSRYANATNTTTGQVWPLDERTGFGNTSANDEGQIAVTTAMFQMLQ